VLDPQRRSRHGKLAAAAETSQISLLYFNARSLANKLDCLFFVLSSYKYQIIAVTETWLSDKYPDALITYGLNYSLFRCDRVARAGGGVCLFVQNCLSATPVCSRNVLKADFLCVDVSDPVAMTGVRISLTYLPPAATTDEVSALCDAAAEFLTTNQEQIWLGDFNLPNAFPLTEGAQLKPPETAFKTFCDTSDLTQIVNKPTRGNNVLDFVLASDVLLDSCNCDCTVFEPFATSDHNSVKLCFNLPHSSHTRERFLDYRNCDTLSLSRFIFTIDWNALFSPSRDVNEATTVFYSILHDAIARFVPVRTRKLQIDTMPEYIRKLFEYRSLLWKESSCPNARRKFSAVSKKLSKLMTKYIQNKEKLLLAKNPNNIFSYVAKQLNPKSQKLPALEHDGRIISDEKAKSELFADYFHSCYNSRTCTDAAISPHFSVGNDALHAFIITPLDVFDMLDHCPHKINSSPDSIPFFLLRSCSAALTYPVFYLFNKSLSTGIVPDPWKESFVVPIPKTGSKSNHKNYRPISLTCSLARLLEKHVSKTLTQYWDKNSLIPRAQHGFRKNMSTTTQLIECHDLWTTSLDSRDPVDVLYVDFRRAFDSVPIPRLLLKISASNVADSALDWLTSFLSSRTFAVKIGNSMSSVKPCISGIPAGTCIGPLLFIYYVADIPAECDTDGVTSVLFADDLKASAVVPVQTPPPLQPFLDNVSIYCPANGLDLAVTKCHVLHLGANNPQTEYSCSGTVIPSTIEPVRDLGVYMSPDLTFKEHVSQIVRSASRKSFCLLKAVRTRDPALLARLFSVYVRPVLEYASPVFNPTTSGLSLELESVQRRASRLILARTSPALRDLPLMERYKLLGMETLEYRRLCADLTLFHKHLLGKTSMETNSIEYYFSVRGDQLMLRRPRARTQARSGSFFVRVAQVYSKLPSALTTINNVSGFELALSRINISAYATLFVK
jgi:hypothetical protein